MNFGICVLTYLALAVSAHSANAALEFVAYLRTGDGKDRFVITDPSRSVVSSWISLGQSFSGYTLTEYQPEREVLVITRDGVPYDLRLKESKVADSKDQAGAAESVVRMILRTDGTVSAAGKTLPVESVSAHLHGLALQNPRLVSYSVLAESGGNPEDMERLKAQLLRAIPPRQGTVVKIQGTVPPSKKQ